MKMVNKQIGLKQAEMSINRFNEMAIPHHLGLLDNHRSNIEKSLALGDWQKIKKEEINALRVIKQIKNLMLEMDALREQVQESDQAQFDVLVNIGKEKAFAGMKQYMELQLKSPGKSKRMRGNSCGLDSDEEEEEQFSGDQWGSVPIAETSAYRTTLPEIEADYEQQKYQLAQRQACLDELELLQHEIRDLHGMFHNIRELVHVQADSVQNIADNAEEALEHVQAGEQNLRRALKYKKAMYPVVGALLGTCVGGPIGLVAGLKAGGLAAVGCGLLGYTGGSVLQSNPAVMQGTIEEQHAVSEQEFELNEAQNLADRKQE